MLERRRTGRHPSRRLRSARLVLASVAALGALAVVPTPGLANTIEVGVGETSVVVDGTTISTSNLTLEQLAKLQGVPPAAVKAELDGLAAETPVAALVESLVAALPLETTLASALEQISNATGGAVNPQTALRQLIEGEDQTGDSGGGGAAGAAGANGAAGAAGANGGSTGGSGAGKGKARKRFTLRAAKRSLKGRPGSRVHVRYSVSSAAKLSYGGDRLAKGSRNVKPGTGVLTFQLPRKHGNYRFLLQAVSTPDGQRAQATIMIHDVAAKKGRTSTH